jgi:ATP-dependent RNA helicase SUPV3L1/SUV3
MAARRAVAQAMPGRVGRLATDDDGSFMLTPAGRLTWRGEEIARLVRGRSLLSPEIEILRNELLDNTARETVRQRLSAWLERHLRKRLAPLFQAAEAEIGAPARGVVFQLCEQLGSVPRRQVRSLVASMSREDRSALTDIGLRFGAHGVFFPMLLRPAAANLRAVLWQAYSGEEAAVLDRTGKGPREKMAPAYASAEASEACWEALGYMVLGPVALRYDRLEQLSARLFKEARGGPFAETDTLGKLAGCRGEAFATVLAQMGFRARPQEGDKPTLFHPKRRPGKNGKAGGKQKAANAAGSSDGKKKPRRRRNRRQGQAPDHASPFAALKDLVTAK